MDAIEGELKFTTTMEASQLARVHRFLINEESPFELNETFSGIRWDGCEWTEETEHLNALITHMREVMPEFHLTGRLRVQEGDRVWLVKTNDDGFAQREEVTDAPFIVCPQCNHAIPLAGQV